MADQHLAKLAGMAAQIAANAPADNDATRAELAAAHITRFWTPTMRQQLLAYAATVRLSPAVRAVVACLTQRG